MTSLEEIQEKFDFVYSGFGDVGEDIIKNFLGSMNGRAKLGESFEVFYDTVCRYPVLDTISDLLAEGGIAPLTEQDLKTLYEHIQRNLKKEE